MDALSSPTSQKIAEQSASTADSSNDAALLREKLAKYAKLAGAMKDKIAALDILVKEKDRELARFAERPPLQQSLLADGHRLTLLARVTVDTPGFADAAPSPESLSRSWVCIARDGDAPGTGQPCRVEWVSEDVLMATAPHMASALTALVPHVAPVAASLLKSRAEEALNDTRRRCDTLEALLRRRNDELAAANEALRRYNDEFAANKESLRHCHDELALANASLLVERQQREAMTVASQAAASTTDALYALEAQLADAIASRDAAVAVVATRDAELSDARAAAAAVSVAAETQVASLRANLAACDGGRAAAVEEAAVLAGRLRAAEERITALAASYTALERSAAQSSSANDDMKAARRQRDAAELAASSAKAALEAARVTEAELRGDLSALRSQLDSTAADAEAARRAAAADKAAAAAAASDALAAVQAQVVKQRTLLERQQVMLRAAAAAKRTAAAPPRAFASLLRVTLPAELSAPPMPQHATSVGDTPASRANRHVDAGSAEASENALAATAAATSRMEAHSQSAQLQRDWCLILRWDDEDATAAADADASGSTLETTRAVGTSPAAAQPRLEWRATPALVSAVAEGGGWPHPHLLSPPALGFVGIDKDGDDEGAGADMDAAANGTTSALCRALLQASSDANATAAAAPWQIRSVDAAPWLPLSASAVMQRSRVAEAARVRSLLAARERDVERARADAEAARAEYAQYRARASAALRQASSAAGSGRSVPSQSDGDGAAPAGAHSSPHFQPASANASSPAAHRDSDEVPTLRAALAAMEAAAARTAASEAKLLEQLQAMEARVVTAEAALATAVDNAAASAARAAAAEVAVANAEGRAAAATEAEASARAEAARWAAAAAAATAAHTTAMTAESSRRAPTNDAVSSALRVMESDLRSERARAETLARTVATLTAQLDAAAAAAAASAPMPGDTSLPHRALHVDIGREEVTHASLFEMSSASPSSRATHIDAAHSPHAGAAPSLQQPHDNATPARDLSGSLLLPQSKRSAEAPGTGTTGDAMLERLLLLRPTAERASVQHATGTVGSDSNAMASIDASTAPPSLVSPAAIDLSSPAALAAATDDYDVASLRSKLGEVLAELLDAEARITLQGEQIDVLREIIRSLERDAARVATFGALPAPSPSTSASAELTEPRQRQSQLDDSNAVSGSPATTVVPANDATSPHPNNDVPTATENLTPRRQVPGGDASSALPSTVQTVQKDVVVSTPSNADAARNLPPGATTAAGFINLAYLASTVVNFVTTSSASERRGMLPALVLLLRLGPAEVTRLQEAVERGVGAATPSSSSWWARLGIVDEGTNIVSHPAISQS